MPTIAHELRNLADLFKDKMLTPEQFEDAKNIALEGAKQESQKVSGKTCDLSQTSALLNTQLCPILEKVVAAFLRCDDEGRTRLVEELTTTLKDHSESFDFEGVGYSRDGGGAVFDDEFDEVGTWNGKTIVFSAFGKKAHALAKAAL